MNLSKASKIIIGFFALVIVLSLLLDTQPLIGATSPLRFAYLPLILLFYFASLAVCPVSIFMFLWIPWTLTKSKGFLWGFLGSTLAYLPMLFPEALITVLLEPEEGDWHIEIITTALAMSSWIIFAPVLYLFQEVKPLDPYFAGACLLWCLVLVVVCSSINKLCMANSGSKKAGEEVQQPKAR